MPRERMSDFSRLHRQVSWRGLHVLAALPGLFLIPNFLTAATLSLAALLTMCLFDPFIRFLIGEYKFVRSILLATTGIYVTTAFLALYLRPLALPFLMLSLSVFILLTVGHVKRFERALFEGVGENGQGNGH